MMWEELHSQPGCYHSAAGLMALCLTICSLCSLKVVEVQLLVRLEPAAQQSEAWQQLEQQLGQAVQQCHLDDLELSVDPSGSSDKLTLSGHMRR